MLCLSTGGLQFNASVHAAQRPCHYRKRPICAGGIDPTEHGEHGGDGLGGGLPRQVERPMSRGICVHAGSLQHLITAHAATSE